jgi:ferrous iron transport protein B
MPSQYKSIALVGNPNAGKTTLFNALTGLNQHTGNYAGVTVQWHAGQWQVLGREVELVDLPGTYSLVPRSPDEAVVLDTLKGKLAGRPEPDAILVVLNAGNLERGLYLVSQVLELGKPCVVALNMVDVASTKGIEIHVQALQRNLGIPVIAVHARSRIGLHELEHALGSDKNKIAPKPGLPDSGEAVAVRARYAWARKALEGVVTRPAQAPRTVSDRMDSLLTHRFWGLVIFLAVVALVFQALFRWAAPLQDGIQSGFHAFSFMISGSLPEGLFKDLLIKGIFAGVGGVAAFVPQIAILFIFMAVLEDCGYMARAAYLMDRLFYRVGLSGRSFIPLLSSFACAVPGVMAARSIEGWRDRMATMLVAPLMSCSARLPVYTIMIAAFVPEKEVLGVLSLRGLTLLAFYLLGPLVAVPVAWLLKHGVLRGPAAPFIIELPHFQWPDPRTVLLRAWNQSKQFLVNAGTLILAVSILVWALSAFPRPRALQERFDSERAALASAPYATAGEKQMALKILSARQASQHLEQSYIGRSGKALEPAFAPLGWDWRITMAALASFPAREVVIATLATIFSVGDAEAEDGKQLREVLKDARRSDGKPLFNLGVALSIMVFFALCAQCAATLMTLKQESGSWKWPALAFAYMTALAWLGAYVAYHLSQMLGWTV